MKYWYFKVNGLSQIIIARRIGIALRNLGLILEKDFYFNSCRVKTKNIIITLDKVVSKKSEKILGDETK
jgi:hypothetical protein